MRHSSIILTVFALALCSCVGAKVEIGKPLPAWQEGELDIHFINTGRGECTWQILPDGTTFLVDASGGLMKYGVDKYNEPIPSRPSSDISAGKVICDYINHFNPSVSAGHIDYFLLTHHHGDHMGNLVPELPMHESGLFQLSSLPEIGSNLIIDRLIDRDPTLTYPTPYFTDNSNDIAINYKAFMDWTAAENGTQIEAWNVGSHSQVTPVHDPDCGVTVQAYSGSGRYWTGEGEESYLGMPTTEEYETLPDKVLPTENHLSCSYILTYGDFDLFVGGDIEYNDREKYPYLDAEAPLIKVAHKVEVMEANHHGETQTHDPALLAVLRPDVWLVGTWRERHPQAQTVDRILEANPNCAIFCTNTPERNIPELGEERMEKIVSKYGHIVVRVARGGESFMVYTLEDGDQLYNVKSIHGPFPCTK